MNIISHTQFVREVAQIGIARLNDEEQEQCHAMITYGIGRPNLRGQTVYDCWKTDKGPVPIVEVCAAGQSDPVQLAGTTLHEIGHVLAGHGAGHGADWKKACARLGLNGVKAVNTVYTMNLFTDDIRPRIQELIDKLEPDCPLFATKLTHMPRAGKKAPVAPPCPAGIGTRGGQSRGAGSGSRMLKLSCTDCGAVWRMAGKWAEQVTACPCCKSENIDKPEGAA